MVDEGILSQNISVDGNLLSISTHAKCDEFESYRYKSLYRQNNSPLSETSKQGECDVYICIIQISIEKHIHTYTHTFMLWGGG